MLAPLATACATSPEDTETGTITLPLVQPGPDGALYHLSGSFRIDGPIGSQTVDASALSSSLTLSLTPGLTTVTLLDGFLVERSLDNGATFTPVAAVLASQNPVPLRVLPNIADTVSFQFFIRSATGNLSIGFGVEFHPRELVGGMVITSGTGVFASYAGQTADYAIYYDLLLVNPLASPDGTRDLDVLAGNVGVEFFNDPFGQLNAIAPQLAGARLEYHLVALPDGSQQLSGTLVGGAMNVTTASFGPSPINIEPVPVDANGFPSNDTFFNQPNVPFNWTITGVGVNATLTGVLKFRFEPTSL